jgi:diguanylate cyclase (GGDEF)-like protein
MKKILMILFVLIVCLPMLLAFIHASGFAGAKVETMMKTRAGHRYLVAQNLMIQKMSEVRLKAGIIGQNRNIRTAVENADLLELIDLLNGLQKDLGINAGGIEVYQGVDRLMVAEPRNPNVFAGQDIVQTVLQGNLAEKNLFVGESLVFMAGVPIYAQGSSLPVAALILYQVVNEAMADQIKSIADAEIVLWAETDGSSRILVSTLIENGRRTFPVLTGLNDAVREVNVGSRRFLVRAGKFSSENGAFYLGVALEKKELNEILNSLRHVFIRAGAGAILFAMLVALLFAGILTRPLGALVKSAQQFGAGELQENCEISSVVPELNFLASTFAKMMGQIRQKIEELEAARNSLDRKVFDLSVRNLINQAIISKSEDSVLRELLEIVADTMQTKRCSMLLVDQVSGDLSLKVAVVRGENPAEVEFNCSQVSFAGGEGFAGFAARHGKSVFSNDPLNDSRFKKMARPVKNLISVPLFDEDKVIGVINVADREESFSEEDALMLQGVADQIAIALQKARLYELAITDGLTGLFIHRYFQMRLESEIARANRGSEKLALIMFDIDHFKKFNDTYGHQVGDRVIRLVSERIKKNIREGIDIAARYGGEEFTVIMPETGIEGAMAFAERLRQAIEETTLEHEGQTLKVTISLGCAVFPEHAATRENLICNADSALYRSKENGRNCSTAFSADNIA